MWLLSRIHPLTRRYIQNGTGRVLPLGTHSVLGERSEDRESDDYARSETLAEKPSFRSAYKRRRCIILADGYYEWKQVPGDRRKQPVYIRLQSQKPFALAGLWEVWQAEGMDEPIRSCTIITCPPNALLEKIHHRMPVIYHKTLMQSGFHQMNDQRIASNPFLSRIPMKRWRRIPYQRSSIVRQMTRWSVIAPFEVVQSLN